MPLVSAAPRRRVTVEVNGPARGVTPSPSPHADEPATPLHHHGESAATPPDVSPTVVVVHTFVEPIHLSEEDDDAPSPEEEAGAFIEPLKRSPSPLLTARSTPPSKLSLLLPLFFAVLGFALWIWFLVSYLDELSGWNEARCDSSSGSTVLYAPNSTVDSGILFPSSTGVTEATALGELRGDVAKIFHNCVLASQLFGLLGTLLFGLLLDKSSGWVSALGVFLDALLLSVFFWGVYLFLSETVCSFAFFKWTLGYCLVQMAILVGFVSTLGKYQRARRKAEQTVVQRLPASPTGGGGGVELANGVGSSGRASDAVSGLPFSPTTNRARGGSAVGPSTLPTLQPFQHPAFPMDAPVPLFVVQMHPDQRAPAVAPLPTESASAAASSSSSAGSASPVAAASGDTAAPTMTVSVRSSPTVDPVHALSGEEDVYDANQLQYQSV